MSNNFLDDDFVDEEYEVDPEFEKLMEQEGNIYGDVSEMSRRDSDDDMSVMSFATINQDKYFIAPDADLDLVMEKLLT